MRDLLHKAVQEYNKTCTTKSWKIKEEIRKLVYNLIKCPASLLDIMKQVVDKSKWEHSPFTMDNLEGDYYVPGHVIGGVKAQPWAQIKDCLSLSVFDWLNPCWLVSCF